MVTRSRTVILGFGYVTTSTTSESEGEEYFYEFTGTGGNSVEILDSTGARAFARLTSIKVFISGSRRPSSWWTAAQGTLGTVVTLTGVRKFPAGADCCIEYRPLVV